MTTPDRLAELLGVQRAEVLRRRTRELNRTVEVDEHVEWKRSGYTGARVGAVIIRAIGRESVLPQRRVIKLSPPNPHANEPLSHRRALEGPWQSFAERHIVKLRDHVVCPDDWIVTIQEIAGGSLNCKLLSELHGGVVSKACRIISRSLRDLWSDRRVKTIADLLRAELRHDDDADQELVEWATSRGLLDQTAVRIRTEMDGVLPNPFSLLRQDSPARQMTIGYLTGPSHGDLHGGNIVIPLKSDDETPDPSAFQLIDLTTFEPDAPLSRDTATLMVSTLVSSADNMGDPRQLIALIKYVVHHDDAARRGLPRDLYKIVDALTDVDKATFVDEGFSEDWKTQLKVSLLAQALLHCTYDSIGQNGRWWCLRLAAHLAGKLLPAEAWPADVTARGLGPEIFGNAGDGPTEPGADHPLHHPVSPLEVPVEYPPFVDREGERQWLSEALASSASRIIVVTGFPGVGKSTLVERVLDEYVRGSADRSVRTHDASPWTGLDAKTLIDDVEGGDTAAMRIQDGEIPAMRLRAAIERLRGRHVVIVIESADDLLDENRRIRDRDLDDALHVVAGIPGGTVKIILVGRRAPEPSGGSRWSSVLNRDVPGLPSEIFLSLLDSLGRPGTGLSKLPRLERAKLPQLLDGNPRHAVILDQILSLGGMRPAEVMTRLSAVPAEDIPQFLADQVVQCLPECQRWVVFALAAFGTPVSEDMVIELLRDKHEPESVQAALDKLTADYVVRRTVEQRFSVPSADIDNILNLIPGGEAQASSFLELASDVLSRRQKLTSEAKGMADLDLHMAQVNILLRGHMYGDAHELMESTDEVLPWYQREWLLPQRELVRGRLDDAFAEMQNNNALGDIYLSRGKFNDAYDAYNRALKYASTVSDYRSRPKIHANMAALHWERDETAKAWDKYEEAFHVASEHDDSITQVIALEGMADCYRRWGRYDNAIERAERAVTRAQHADLSRAAIVAVKLARWHAELGHAAEAFRWIEIAEGETAEHPGELLRAVCCDARADLLLGGSEVDVANAVLTARRAVHIAMAEGDPVIQLQARTTLCFAYLLRDNVAEARREIEHAARYRRPGRSLIVLALQALTWLESNPTKARRLFDKLFDEATGRRSGDERDFAAWDFEGIAICGRADHGESLAPAIRTFAVAREMTPATPGLVGRLAFIVDQIGRRHQRPNRFGPVLEVLGKPIGANGT